MRVERAGGGGGGVGLRPLQELGFPNVTRAGLEPQR